jgi:hypothetical protein
VAEGMQGRNLATGQAQAVSAQPLQLGARQYLYGILRPLRPQTGGTLDDLPTILTQQNTT